MNKKRRLYIKRASVFLNKSLEILERITDEESDSLDNIPDNLQSGQRYETIERNVEILEDVVSGIEEAISLLSNVS